MLAQNQTPAIAGADTIAVTVFSDHAAKTKREFLGTWDQLREAVLQKDAATKGALPWLKLARFGDTPTTKSSLRHDANVLAITGIEADYDGEKVTPEDAEALLKGAGVKALIYTSPSHTDDKPRWRVLCPTSEELPPQRREGLVARLNGVLGGILAGESFTISQAYYYGSVNKNLAHRAIMVAGQPIDLLSDLDAGAVGRSVTKGAAAASTPSTKAAATSTNPPVARAQNDTAALIAEITSGTGYHDATIKLAGRMAKQDIPRTVAKRELTAAFDAVPEDQKDTRWKQRRADVVRCVDGIYAKEACDGDGEKAAAKTEAKEEKGPPPQDLIIDAVLDAGVTFWREADGEVYARVPQGEGLLNIQVRAQRFESLCRQLYGKAFPVMGAHGLRPAAVSDHAVKTAIGAFIAMGLGSDEVHTPGVRLAEYEGAIWIDLGDDTHCAVRVTADGWSVEAHTLAPLVRKNGMRALPVPVRSGESSARLRSLLNIASDDDFRLACAWLVAALRPTGPYAIIAVNGEHGSGKSTTCEMLRQLVDPNAADLRGVPKCEDDLLLAALNSRVVGIDNVSTFDNDMSDALCRVSTGAGFSKRTLYSNLDETIISVCRPIVMNGIPDTTSQRSDLSDRTIALTLPMLPKRLTKGEVWGAFEAAAPGIFALLLDALATGLRRLPEVKFERLPRMADFALLACASAPAFGWDDDQMIGAIERSRDRGAEAVIENDAVACAVLEVADEYPKGWTGTVSEMLGKLKEAAASDDVVRDKAWPKGAAQLSNRLARVAPVLRRVGVLVEAMDRVPGSGKKPWRIVRVS